MKKGIKAILCTVLALIVLGALAIGIPKFCFGYDIFDRSGWSTDRYGTVRYLTKEGDPLFGWQEIDGETYYFSPEYNGALATGWIEFTDGRYYLNEQGAAQTGWLDVNGNRYWLDEESRMSIGWTEIGESRYYFEKDGTMATGWLYTEDGQYYLSESGAMQTGWLLLDNAAYYLDETGLMRTGWTEIGENRFCFAEDGAAVTGWLDTAEGRYHLSESGAMTVGWYEEEDNRYYFDENGLLYFGWLKLGNRQYYLTESGAAYTGWMEEGEDRYYFHDDGVMAIGRVEIDGAVHHFTSTGKYFVLVNPWNPVPEGYEPDLVEINGFKIDASCLAALEEMIADCEAAGHSCKITSGYRSYDRQVFLFERKVTKLMGQGYSREAAEKETALSIAIPGTSEHQLGLAVDLKNGNDTYSWLAKNSWKYGFTMRYPFGKTALTGIYYEPWHFRYVGLELAKELYDLGLCVEEYMNLLTEQAKL